MKAKSKYKNYFKAIEKGYWTGNMKYCNDITNEWLKVKQNRVNKVIKHKINDTFKYKGKEYYIDGKKIVVELKNGEEEFAYILSKLTDRRIELFPRFNEPRNKKSADSKIGKEYVDFKITTSGSDHFIYDNVYKAQKQSSHFAFNITNDKVSKDEIMYQVDNTFRRIKCVKTIIINSKYGLFVYKR